MAHGDDDKLIDVFVADAAVESAARYAERGRAFASLSEDELSERWIAAFRAWARDWASEERGTERDDLEAEFMLRGLRPPYGVVGPELDALKEQTAAALERLNGEPERRAILNEHLKKQLEAFVASMDGPRS